ncbi:hypothetical protein [Caldalkalibacillus salinus]|uniref:hypothetical protein n=1 Tax=Caldalkalibacillus salinus TaxID=2803787 RepID=UPI0019233CAD|nr:hypothetical protein [Caldalkalibacillus salinus]
MGLRSLELQVAIPRTQDAGMKQDQLNQRHTVQHYQATEEQKLKHERERIKSSKVDKKTKEMLGHDHHAKQHYPSHKQHQYKPKNEIPPEPTHPYKGKRIDISL